MTGRGDVLLLDTGEGADDVDIGDVWSEIDRRIKIVSVRPARQLDGRANTSRLDSEVRAGAAAPLCGLHELGHISNHGRLEADVDVEVEGDLGGSDNLFSRELGQEERDEEPSWP